MTRDYPGTPHEIVSLDVLGRLSLAWYKKLTINCGERKTRLFVVSVPEVKQYGLGAQVVLGEQCFVASVHNRAVRS